MSRPFVLFPVLTCALACTPQGDPTIGTDGFRDRFERRNLGPLWHNTGGPYKILKGALRVKGARNKPLWLKRALPRDVRIEFDARSESQEGDIKAELFGDGVSKATTESYTASGYVVILGGWGNSKNVIARMNEHGSDRAVGPKRRVEPGRTYRVRIERRGPVLTTWLDGHPWVTMRDTKPLFGRGHDHFAFNNWSSDLWFDNLVITPL